MRKAPFFILFLLLVAPSGWTQELILSGGETESTSTHDKAVRWGLAYQQGLSEHWAAGLTYINEGHISGHHRDGWEPQIWLRTNVIDRRLSLAAGIGPYFWFDTESTRSYSFNAHGWGAVASVAATWYTESRFLYQIRANWIKAVNDFDSVSITGGIGFQLDKPLTEGPLRKAPVETSNPTGSQLTLFGGESVLNRFESQPQLAEAVEYRYGLAPHVDVTGEFFNEGPHRRMGVASQIWAVRSFVSDKLVFGVGLGPYAAHDPQRGPDGSSTLNGLIGMTAAYDLTDHWVSRFTWNRVITNYSHDADLFLLGLGYRF